MYKRQLQLSTLLLFYFSASSSSSNSSPFSSLSFANSGNSCSTSTSSPSSISSSSLSSSSSDAHWSFCISSTLSTSSSTSFWRSLPYLLRASIMAFRPIHSTSTSSTTPLLLSSNVFFSLFEPLGPASGSSAYASSPASPHQATRTWLLPCDTRYTRLTFQA